MGEAAGFAVFVLTLVQARGRRSCGAPPHPRELLKKLDQNFYDRSVELLLLVCAHSSKRHDFANNNIDLHARSMLNLTHNTVEFTVGIQRR